MIAPAMTLAAVKQSPAVASLIWSLTASMTAHVLMDAVEISIGMTTEQAMSLLAWSTVGMLGGAARVAHSTYQKHELPAWTMRRSLLAIFVSGFVGMMTAALIDGFHGAWIHNTGPRVFFVSLAAFSADALLGAWDVGLKKAKLGATLSDALGAAIRSFLGAKKGEK